MLHLFNCLHVKAVWKFDCFDTAEQFFFVITRQEADSTEVVSIIMRCLKMNYDINRERKYGKKLRREFQHCWNMKFF